MKKIAIQYFADSVTKRFIKIHKYYYLTLIITYLNIVKWVQSVIDILFNLLKWKGVSFIQIKSPYFSRVGSLLNIPILKASYIVGYSLAIDALNSLKTFLNHQ